MPRGDDAMSPKRRKTRVDGAEARIRIAFRLSPECIRRLRVACAMEDSSPNRYLERLIAEATKRWVVQDRIREPGLDSDVDVAPSRGRGLKREPGQDAAA